MELNMTPNEMHPSEFAYAFAFAKVEDIVGWGAEPFLPPGTDGTAWATEGAERLLAAGLLVGTPGQGLNFTEEMTSTILALVDPAIVFLAQRKAGDGMQKLTIHLAGDDLVGLTRDADGMFELTRYGDLTAAVAACATFVGASLTERDTETRIDTSLEALTGLKTRVRAGDTAGAVAALVASGAASPEATSAAHALASPVASGVLSVLYCVNNVVEMTETFSVITNADDHSWIIFAPGSLNGPMILERSSVGALTARVAVGVVARLATPG